VANGTRAARALWIRINLHHIIPCINCDQPGDRCHICRKALGKDHWSVSVSLGTGFPKAYPLCSSCAEPLATMHALQGDTDA
jgi:hypothetical protein